jgi:hypothetical protein
MQCACAIIPYVACPSLKYFSTFSHKGTILEKKKLLNTKCVFWFSLQLFSETVIILRINKRDVIKNVHWSSCKVRFMLVRFNETWILSTDFLKSYQTSWKFFRLEPRISIRMDRRTKMTKLIVAFRDSANEPKSCLSLRTYGNTSMFMCNILCWYTQSNVDSEDNSSYSWLYI